MTEKTSDPNIVTINLEPFLTPISIIIGSIIIFVGISMHSGRTIYSNNTTAITPTPTQAGFAEAETTLDDDPYIGNKDTAKVAIVEFSDYECPVCKRHFLQTYPDIVKEYVNTGKAIIVFRDFPLAMHEPNASQQAEAGECVQDLAGTEAYFKYHDIIFNTTTSNKGIDKSKLYDIAVKSGVDKARFTECFDGGRFAEEVKKDVQDGIKAGVQGTPGFIIGKFDSSGKVTGKRIDGAYALSYYQEVINSYL